MTKVCQIQPQGLRHDYGRVEILSQDKPAGGLAKAALRGKAISQRQNTGATKEMRLRVCFYIVVSSYLVTCNIIMKHRPALSSYNRSMTMPMNVFSDKA